jgi:UrcA family protein
MLKFATSLLGLACASAFVAAGPPAFGEGVGEFTVIGNNERPNDHSLSAAISYRDLDLTTKDGQAMLRHRVWKTAQKLCARLGEGHVAGASQVGSCEDQAFFGTAEQRRDAIARAMVARAMQPVVASVGARADGAPATGNYILTVSVVGSR